MSNFKKILQLLIGVISLGVQITRALSIMCESLTFERGASMLCLSVTYP